MMDSHSPDLLKRVETALRALRATMSSFRHSSPSTDVADQDLSFSTPTKSANIPEEAKQSGHWKHVLVLDEVFSPNDSNTNSNTYIVESTSVSSSSDLLSLLLLSIDELTCNMHLRPYSIPHRLLRACWYSVLGYPDLAAGDAYKVLLLLDEASDEAGEYHEEVLDDLRNWIRGYCPSGRQGGETRPGSLGFVLEIIHELEYSEVAGEAFDSFKEDHEEQALEKALEWLEEICYVTAYRVLARSLWICRCWKSAVDFLERGRRHFSEHRWLKMLEEDMLKAIGEDLASEVGRYDFHTVSCTNPSQ